MEYLTEQVSILAHGVAGRFYDIDPEEAAATLAVLLHRRTEEGATECMLPACTADLIWVWNKTQPKKKKQTFSDADGLPQEVP